MTRYQFVWIGWRSWWDCGFWIHLHRWDRCHIAKSFKWTLFIGPLEIRRRGRRRIARN